MNRDGVTVDLPIPLLPCPMHRERKGRNIARLGVLARQSGVALTKPHHQEGDAVTTPPEKPQRVNANPHRAVLHDGSEATVAGTFCGIVAAVAGVQHLRIEQAVAISRAAQRWPDLCQVIGRAPIGQKHHLRALAWDRMQGDRGAGAVPFDAKPGAAPQQRREDVRGILRPPRRP